MSEAAIAIAQKVTDWLNGVWRDDKNPPCGENLRCTSCRKHTMRITIGDRKGKPVVFCICGAPSKRLINGIRKATGIWLVPPPRREPPGKVVERMRRSPEYEGLSSRSKRLVDLLVEAVLDDGLVNGGIVMSATQLMAALGTRSGKQLYKAVNAAVAAKIVIRRSQASSNGQNKGPSNLWGLTCLPIDYKGLSERRAKPSSKHASKHDRNASKGGNRWGEKAPMGGGNRWGESVDEGGIGGTQPFDTARGGCAVVYEPTAPAPSDRPGGVSPAGRATTVSPEGSERQWSQRTSRSAEPEPASPARWRPKCGGYDCGKADECLRPGSCVAMPSAHAAPAIAEPAPSSDETGLSERAARTLIEMVRPDGFRVEAEMMPELRRLGYIATNENGATVVTALGEAHVRGLRLADREDTDRG